MDNVKIIKKDDLTVKVGYKYTHITYEESDSKNVIENVYLLSEVGEFGTDVIKYVLINLCDGKAFRNPTSSIYDAFGTPKMHGKFIRVIDSEIVISV